MKVAHVIHGLEVGGLERLVVDLADRSRTFDVEPAIVSFGPDGPVRSWAEEARVPLHWVGEVAGLSAPAVRGLASCWQSSVKGCRAGIRGRLPVRDLEEGEGVRLRASSGRGRR